MLNPSVTAPGSAESRPGEASQLLEQFVLEQLILDAGGRLGAALVIPVAAGGARLRIIAGGEPFLREVPQAQVVGRTRAAHPHGYPARVHRVAEHVRPDAGDGERER